MIYNPKEYFSIPIHNLSSFELIKNHIKENYNGVVIVGNKNSRELVKNISNDAVILDDDSYNFSGKDTLIINNSINTGSTILKELREVNSKESNIIAIHALFSEKKLNELKNYTHSITSCNTIENETNEIDITNLIATKLMQI